MSDDITSVKPETTIINDDTTVEVQTTETIIPKDDAATVETKATETIINNDDISVVETKATETITKDDTTTVETNATGTIINNDETSVVETKATETITKDDTTTVETNATETIIDNDETSVVETNATETIINNDETSVVETKATETITNDDTSVVETKATETITNDDTSVVETNATETINNDEASVVETKATETITKDDTTTVEANATETIINNDDTITVEVQKIVTKDDTTTINMETNATDTIFVEDDPNEPIKKKNAAKTSTTIVRSFVIIAKASYVNVFLIFVPLGFVANELGWDSRAIFAINFLATIPLQYLLDFLTKDLALRLGETLGGLLSATFGNAVELFIGTIALMQGQILIVQASMIGSITSNLLLALGMCFLFGGYGRHIQKFSQTAAQTSSSLMTLACIALIMPAMFNAAIAIDTSVSRQMLNLSHGTALILLCVYCLYLFFQLKTHKELYHRNYDETKVEKPKLSFVMALVVLAGTTVLVSFCTDFLVSSIEDVIANSPLTKMFIGFILLPIVGNAARHVTAVSVAMKDRMDLAIGVSIGSSMQIALFVTPFLVIVGWIINQPMALLFQVFETMVLFASILITNSLIQAGESNWLKGVLLFATYGIIALSFFYYPDPPEATPM